MSIEYDYAQPETDVLATYVLQLIGPNRPWTPIREISPALLREAEENLTDLLPLPYKVRIKEWDSDE